MKIKQVCIQTGLTPRAVRFYCDRGLVNPEVYCENDRNYYEYSDEDLRMLRRIHALRQADFSLEEIARMLRVPAATAQIVQGHREAMEGQSRRLGAILQELCRLEAADMNDFAALADALIRSAKGKGEK